MGVFVRNSTSPSDKYGPISYYVDNYGFVRKSTSPNDKYGAIVYYVDDGGFVRKSNSPSDMYGQIIYYLDKEPSSQKTTTHQPKSAQGGMLLVLALVLALLLAPIIIVLGMYGKFLLKGLYENVLKIDEFKKFRKTYMIICFSWFAVGIALTVVFALFDALAQYCLYPLVVGNIVLFVLSIVFGNKIYKKHKDALPVDVHQDEIDTNADLSISAQDEVVEEVCEEEIEEQSPIEEITSDDPMLKNLSAIKQLKELLDIGAITQKEFDEKKKLLLSSVGGENKYSISKNTRSSGIENDKGLRIFNLILSILGVAAYVVGVVFLFALEFRYLEGYNDGQQIWTYMPFHIATFSWSEVGPRNATLCMFTFFGAILMAASLIFKLIIEIKQGKQHPRKLIVWDIVTILISAVPIVFSAILVDWAKPGVKLFLILAASCAIAIFVHLLSLLAKKFIEFVRSK